MTRVLRFAVSDEQSPFAHRRRFRLAGYWLSLFALGAIVAVSGCGKSDDAPADDQAAEEAVSEAAGADQSDQAAAEPADKKKKQDAEKQPEPTPSPDQTAEKPGRLLLAEPEREMAPRPDDVGRWSADDLVSAKRQRDPRLLDAVAHIGEHLSGDPRAVPMLAALFEVAEYPEPDPQPQLEPDPKKKKKSSGRDDDDELTDEMIEEMEMDDMIMGGAMNVPRPKPKVTEDTGLEDWMRDEIEGYDDGDDDTEKYGGRSRGRSSRAKLKATRSSLTPGYVSLTGGIIRALGANGTPEARQVLRELLAGRIDTGRGRAATSAVLRTLVDFPSLENDALLYQALTAAQQFRPTEESVATEGEGEDGGKAAEAVVPDIVTAEKLRDATLLLVERSASMRLRVDLAKYLIGSNASPEIGPRLQELVAVSHPYNIKAQVGLYRWANTPPEMRSQFEQYFTTYGAAALGRILGIATAEDIVFETVRPGAADQVEPIAGPRKWRAFGDTTPPAGGQDRGQGRGRGRTRDDIPSEFGDYDDDMDDVIMGSGAPRAKVKPRARATRGRGGYEELDDMDWLGLDGPDEQSGGGRKGSAWQAPARSTTVDEESVAVFQEVAASNPDVSFDIAREVWGNSLGATIAGRLNSLGSLQDGAQVVMLASTIPTDAMRAQLHKTLAAHWEDGSDALASADAFPETGTNDPGFLTVIKSLPRKEPPTKARTEGKAPEITEQQAAQFSWMATSYETVLDFCRRFHAAAQNEASGQAAVLESLPLRLHPDAATTAAYHADWQQRVGSRITGVHVDPMQVYYVRIEESNQFSKVLGFYRRAVKSADVRQMEEGDVWIDALRIGRQPGQKASIDVIITRSDFDEERPASEPEPLVVDILYVEVKDPAPRQAE